jgi:hypothetical protein
MLKLKTMPHASRMMLIARPDIRSLWYFVDWIIGMFRRFNAGLDAARFNDVGRSLGSLVAGIIGLRSSLRCFTLASRASILLCLCDSWMFGRLDTRSDSAFTRLDAARARMLARIDACIFGHSDGRPLRPSNSLGSLPRLLRCLLPFTSVMDLIGCHGAMDAAGRWC